MDVRWSTVLLATALLEACTGGDEVTAARPTPSVEPDGAAGSQHRDPEVRAGAERDAPPLVDLAGQSQPVSLTVVKSGPRIYSRAQRTWIRERPTKSSPRLGYLRAGSSSPTTPAPAGHEGCRGGWYPVEPRGFVCAGPRATLDADDAVVRATREHPPDHARRLPYIYGTVRHTGPIYARLPSAEALQRFEPEADEWMQRWLHTSGEAGAGYAQDVWLGGAGEPPDPTEVWAERRTEGVPWFLDGTGVAPSLGRTTRGSESFTIGRTRRRVGYAFLETFLYEGRRYGVTTDLAILPTDRLRPIRGSSFHGVRIGVDIGFPFAFVRRVDARFYLYQASTGRMIDAGKAPYRAAVRLTGKQRFYDGKLHYETIEGRWLVDREASRLDPAKRMPAWGKRGEKWIDVNLTKQTIVLYEGERPVYATLISSGEAGLEDPEHTTATKRGIFRIHTKHVTATMSSDEVGERFELRDVPYVQYFDREGYALHGAYWHDRFGTPKSHGCLNLAPEDARRIFYWTEPRLPRGWHGVLLPLRGTILFVHP